MNAVIWRLPNGILCPRRHLESWQADQAAAEEQGELRSLGTRTSNVGENRQEQHPREADLRGRRAVGER